MSALTFADVPGCGWTASAHVVAAVPAQNALDRIVFEALTLASEHGENLLRDYRLRARREQLLDERHGESGYELACLDEAITCITDAIGDGGERDYEMLGGA